MAFATSEILFLFVYFPKMYIQGGVQELIFIKPTHHPFCRERLTLLPPVSPGFLLSCLPLGCVLRAEM